MESSFIIRKKNSHVEVNFDSGKNRHLLDWIPFPAVPAARAFIRKLKRYRDVKFLGELKYEGQYFFVLCNAGKARLCCSHGYSSAQRARDGGLLFLEKMKGADIIEY
jgi:hypothetical protein